MARLQEEQKRKHKIAEEIERIDTLGQEDEHKAAKAVIEDIEKGKKIAKAVEDDDLTRLDSKRKHIVTYKEELARILYTRLMKNAWPKGYRFLVKITPKGIEVNIKNAENKWFGRGITITNVPEYDLNAAIILVIQADNTLAISEKTAQAVNGRIAPLWVMNYLKMPW